MSNRLFNTAQSIHTEEEVKKLINVYSKVEKESDEIRKATKKYQPPMPKKQVSSEQVIKMINKNQKPQSIPRKQSVQKKPIVQNKANIKQRISHLKQQINSQQKSLNSTKKITVTTYKQQLEYNIFRFKMLAKRITDFQVSVERSFVKCAFGLVKDDWNRSKVIVAKFVLKRQKNIMRKYFNQFCKQTIILKLERQKVQHKAFLQKQEMNQKTAQDFREFTLLRRAINTWKLERQKLIQQQKQKKNQIVSSQKDNLKSKLYNLISKIREDINAPAEVESKRELEIGENNTIKQQFEQSIDSRAQDWANEPDNIVQDTDHKEQQVLKTVTIPKKMTNDDLFKKRQQLELKNKQRKDALQKLKRQKQQLKLKLEQQKRIEEQQFRETERKKNKGQHQKFLQKKRQEEQRKKKEQAERKRIDQLYVLAEKHNELRIMKYKGLVPWKKMMADKKQKLQQLLFTVVKVQLSSNWRYFKQKYDQHNKQLEQNQQFQLIQAEKYYQRKMKKNVIQIVKTYNDTVAKQQNLFLQNFRNNNRLRQMFSIWKKQIPNLKQQNYHLQTKQNKVIDQFRYKFLLKTGFQAFRLHKQQEQRERRILEHKIKIKQKMQQFKGKRQQIDIDKLI